LLDVDPPFASVRDLGSRNGTFVNGMQIGHPWTWPPAVKGEPPHLDEYDLHDGDELRVGDTVFLVHLPEPAEYLEAEVDCLGCI
jgi:pSer/pThr/pTyr-binding forkhead associated (FHA) protein